MTLTAAAASGATTLAVTAPALRAFQVGEPVLVWHDWKTCSVVMLTALGTNSLTTSPTGQAFAAGDLVLPLLVAEPHGPAAGTLLTDWHRELKIQVHEATTQTYPVPAAPPWTVYRGYPILNLPANWSSNPGRNDGQDVVRNQYGYGRMEAFARWPQSHVQMGFENQRFDRAGVNDLVGTFAGQHGRLEAFWIADLAPACQPLGDMIGDTFTAHSIEYASWFADAHGASRKYLAFIDQTGTVLPRKILQVIDNHDGTETWQVEAAIGLYQGQVQRVAWLLLMRVDQDVLVLNGQTDTMAKTALTAVELPMEVPA